MEGLPTFFMHGSMRRLTLTLEIIRSLVASMSPVYTTFTISGSVRWMWAIAVHKTRSPPPPALLQAAQRLREISG